MLEPLRQVGQWATQKAQSLPVAINQPKTDATQGQPPPAETPSLFLASQVGSSQPWVTQPPDAFEATQPKQAGFTMSQGKVLWQAGKEQVNLFKHELLQTPVAQKITSHWPRKKPQASAPENPFSQAAQPPGAQKPETRFSDKIAQKLRLRKPPPQAQPSVSRSREMVMKDFPFPYRDLSKVPRFTLTPEEIAINPQVEKQIQLVEAEIMEHPWNSENIFLPLDG